MFKKIILPAVVILAAFVLGYVVRGGSETAGPHGHDHADDAAADPSTWVCSMHPQIQLPEFGQCPICFMDLIPLEKNSGAGLGPADLAISESAMALAEIRTEPVRREPVAREVRLTGQVAVDETRTRAVTARIAGRLDRLHVNFTGRQVVAGDLVAEIYSPRLYQARSELLAARTAVQEGRPGARSNLESVQERLRLWGLDPAMVAYSTGDHVPITTPVGGTVVAKPAVEGAYVNEGQSLLMVTDLDRVWVELDAFETDLPWLAVGQEARFSVTALPGEEFSGTVVFVDPVLDGGTRTVKVRLEADNPEGLLRPGMLTRGVVEAPLDAAGRPGPSLAGEVLPLVVPATAPLLTGERAVVYVRLPGEEPVFSGRVVKLGPRAGDYYVVREGLEEDELVVVNGAFKLDSALQITASPSMMLMADPVPEVEVPACFGGMAVNVVPAYLELQAALAGDDFPAAQAAADALLALFGDHCAESIPTLVQAARQVSGAPDIAAMRVSFQPLSETLWAMVEKVGWRGEQPLRLFHCPMAFADEGANWLQLATETANPYFGAAMFRCGWEVEKLGANGEGES